jgi:hypothetical protein
MFSFAAGYHPSPDSGQKQATATAIGHAGSGILATRAKNRKKGAGQCLPRWYNALAFGIGKHLCRQASGPAFQAPGPDARIAQLVEQRIENPRVGGSNPPPGTTIFSMISIVWRSFGRRDLRLIFSSSSK